MKKKTFVFVFIQLSDLNFQKKFVGKVENCKICESDFGNRCSGLCCKNR